jgi:RimJ/RimL family protein N-acetyltransferase
MGKPPAGTAIPTISIGNELRVRPIRRQDLDAFHALHNDEDVWRAFGWEGPRNRGQNGELLGSLIRGESSQEGAYRLAFAIEDRSGAVPQMVGIVVFVVGYRIADLTVAVGPSTRGRGIAPAVLPAIFEWCRAAAGIDTIVGVAKLQNTGSIRMMEKAGMADQGEQEAVSPGGGEPVRVRQFEWPAP